MAGFGTTLAVGILVPLLLVGGAVGLVALGHGGGFGGMMGMGGEQAHEDSGSQEPMIGGSYEDDMPGMGPGMGMGMMDYDEMMKECEEEMEEMGFSHDDDYWYGNLAEITGTVQYVNIERRAVVIVDDAGEDYLLRIPAIFINMSDGTVTFAPWIVAQLEPGTVVEAKAFIGGDDYGVLAGITIGDSEFLIPKLALETLE